MDSDPEGKRLPIKADTASNGKHLPRPLSRAEQVVNGYARNLVDEVAKAVGSLKGRRRTRADRTTEVLKDALAPRSTGLAPGRHR